MSSPRSRFFGDLAQISRSFQPASSDRNHAEYDFLVARAAEIDDAGVSVALTRFERVRRGSASVLAEMANDVVRAALPLRECRYPVNHELEDRLIASATRLARASAYDAYRLDKAAEELSTAISAVLSELEDVEDPPWGDEVFGDDGVNPSE